MTELSTALRLADAIDPLTRDWLDNLTCGAAAAELRRLHKEIGDWDRVCNQHLKHIDKLKKRMKKAEAVNKELLEALRSSAEYLHDKSGCSWLKSDFQRGCRCSEDCSSVAIWKKAHAAIEKAEGKV
jgi:hypothetical protein